MHFLQRIPGLAAAVLIGLASAGPATAQIETPQGLNAQATDAMKAGKWEDALQLLTTAVDRFDAKGMQFYGPQFGTTWYRKGICELKLKQFEAAAGSFEACYSRYPNDAEQAKGGGNRFNKLALLRWAEAEQGAENWEEAVRLYRKFLEERDKTRDSFQPGSFYINLAICNLRLGKMEEGIQHFETALKNKVAYKTPDAGIVAAFQALIDGVVQSGDEKVVLNFIRNNRADIVIEPCDMPPFAPVFLKLGAKTYEAGMEAVAFALYQLIPSTEVMIQDATSRLERMGDRAGMQDGNRVYSRRNLSESVTRLKKSIEDGDPNEVIQLGATAYLHEAHGNLRGAFASYQQLELFYPKSKRREKNLYNLVRTASLVGEAGQAERFGLSFLKLFPESEFAPAVRRLMLSSLFYGGDYEQCIEIASEMLPNLEKGTEEHQIALHVLGGSYYYTGAFKEAQPLLDEFVETYPESNFLMAALYFQASNESRLQYWGKSARLLDEFMAKYPDPGENIYMPFALYDRANCHYALDEEDAALEKLNRLVGEFPSSQLIDEANNLKGNILESKGQAEEAEACYLAALERAEPAGKRQVAAESLLYLVMLLGKEPEGKGEPPRAKEAVTYADKFWEKNSDTPYKAQIAVAQVPAMRAVGRGEEALDRLRDVIADMANTPGAVGLEEAINTFTDLYLESHSVDELKELYYNFPRIRLENRAARALLRIALIGVYEKQASEAVQKNDQQARVNAEASIKVLFSDLKNDFAVTDLSNFILVSVGDFIRGTNSPTEALPYYDEALSREDKSYQFEALFGRAAVRAKGSEADKKQAVADMQRVFTDAQDNAVKDRALFQMIVTQMDLGQYEKAKEDARLYLDPEKGFNTQKPEVAMMLAKCYDEMGETENALSAYVNVWNTYKARFDLSAPAMLRSMEMFWDRNKPAEDGQVSDKQGAYNAGRLYVDQTRKAIEEDKKIPDEVVAAWRKVDDLVKQYEAHPDVRSKEQLEEEQRNR